MSPLWQVYHDMETAGLTPTIRTYHAMIDGCALAGQIAKAFGVYGIMISKVISRSLLSPVCEVFLALRRDSSEVKILVSGDLSSFRCRTCLILDLLIVRN